MNDGTLNTSYFRRFFVPVILTTLVFAAAIVLITTPPKSAVPWQTFNTVFGGAGAATGMADMVGGAVRRAVRRLK